MKKERQKERKKQRKTDRNKQINNQKHDKCCCCTTIPRPTPTTKQKHCHGFMVLPDLPYLPHVVPSNYVLFDKMEPLHDKK
jgi:hypothetical protein